MTNLEAQSNPGDQSPAYINAQARIAELLERHNQVLAKSTDVQRQIGAFADAKEAATQESLEKLRNAPKEDTGPDSIFYFGPRQ